MKRLGILGLVLVIFIGLAACSGSNYEDEVTEVVKEFKAGHGSMADKVTRKNSAILVYEDGKYIGIACKMDKRIIEAYYKKMSGTKNRLELVTNLDIVKYIKEDAEVSYKERYGKKIKSRKLVIIQIFERRVL
ncbi:cystatin-like fold lipoprotein [Listeria booriae]|uniref:cystatin-like fold lipoprotein n=1 Tax=Listeria booriae TaxID=1552123 RepID=UPI0016291EBB|nr:cystatin-like fold lipoprotein [Listeria booriae]MBC2193656.1 cystatin-like fold lipoprotein [Listeria booriae]